MEAFASAIGLVTTGLSLMASVLAIVEAELAPVLIAVAAVAGTIALINWFSSKKVRKANKEIERQEVILEELQKKYNDLGEEVDKVFGKDFLKNVEARLKNIKAQIATTTKKLEEERKKGKKADENVIKGYLMISKPSRKNIKIHKIVY